MNLVYAFVLLLVTLLVVLAAVTRAGVLAIERAYPPVGEYAVVNGTRMHFVHEKAGPDADLPALIFLHGASGNLADQMVPFRAVLSGRADLLFVDRPGHGWSSRGPRSNELPDGQAETIGALLDHLGLEKAIIVGHSFGGAIAVSFALNHPEKTAGTVFLAPVSHPWPGGVSWYYNLTAIPLIGWLFTETLALPAGYSRLPAATGCVFAPNRQAENYARNTGVSLVLRPSHFRANSVDVARLFDYVTDVSPRYPEIKTPSVVITGNKDTIVLPRIHSLGLAKDLQNVELVWVENLGHKPDYIATGLAVAAIESVAGMGRDLQSMARQLEVQLADNSFGPVHRCLE